MLISPAEIHSSLTSLLGSEGPHTAIVIYPQGQLISSAFLSYHDEEDAVDGVAEQGQDGPGSGGGGGHQEGDEAGEEEEEGEEEEDEPYLDNQERMRLILGLAVQWAEDESDRVECELGRLLMTPLPLSPPDPTPSALVQNLPSARSQTQTNYPKSLVLVLNGSKDTPWSVLSAKAEEFKKGWKA